MRPAADSLRRALALRRLLPTANSHYEPWNSSAAIELVAGQCRGYGTRSSDGILQDELRNQLRPKRGFASKEDQTVDMDLKNDAGITRKQRIGKNISPAEKRKFLVNTLFDLKDSKEAVYGTLDAWVAWEQEFPLSTLKRALLVLEKEEQWHRVVQVIKWILSKGQGTTVGTYEQLIRALEKDNRAEEAHNIWVKKLSYDLHSVPWRVCDLMISIYYRNNMLDRLVKLFKGLEEFDRKPPHKSIVQKVSDAYEMLGLLDEKDIVLEKYSHLFDGSSEGHFRKSKKASKKDKKSDNKRWENSVHASEEKTLDSGPSDAEVDIAV